MHGYYSDDEFECETCSRVFSSQHAVNQHMNALGHRAPRFECDTCYFSSFSQSVVNQHMSDEGHCEHYCRSCQRQFQNDNNLQMHLKSKIHLGQNIKCPFCKVAYTTASGVTHHLETGSCPRAPKANRRTLRDMIRQRDPNGIISNKLLEWHQDEDARYDITNRAYNGSGWECYLCHREFVHSRALNQHLNSPAHQQKAYHCPNGRCGKQFVTLAALFNHLESETCSFMRFERVQQGVTSVLRGDRLIAF
ncbi:zinc finger protein [Penicillium lagena]|uniref:zinc finger protein n=1 Tax=Penicillium lagena TaxID=94218 RepID=UPI002540308C|nr:zinc finger protein [Penicillium lagena]KAJ5610787.1 zinc finger protein [Penicillium lagena]